MTDTLLVEPSSGRAISFLGIKTIIKIRGQQTSGAFVVVENSLPPRGFVPPHRHEHVDEVAYVLEGELGALVGENRYRASAGSFVARPRGIVHALWNSGDMPVRFFEIIAPAGHETFFEALAQLFASSVPPVPAQLAEVAGRYDVTFLPELAPSLAKEYNLHMPG